MDLLYNDIFFGHATGIHPESSKRLEPFRDLNITEIENGEPYLELVHNKDYIEKVKNACLNSIQLDQDTVTCPGSWDAALNGVGATIMAAKTNSFALVRPPGHHAFPDKASGFCLFNNMAITVQKLVQEGNKVLIFDFDGHLGDGTSHIFYDSNQVMFWSQHQNPAFPGNGHVDEIGEKEGRGFTINMPLPAHSGDDIFMDAVREILPIAKQFKPDIVAVSAGFDAHRFDPVLDLKVTSSSFYKIGKLLGENFNNIFATLEGGYSVMDLYRGVLNFQAGINGVEMPFDEPQVSSRMNVWEEYDLNKHMVFSNLSEFWDI